MNIDVLKKIGFSDKTAMVYLALVRLGPSSVRALATCCELNRGTTYDALKWLTERDLVTFYKQETKQLFVAKSPDKLKNLVESQLADFQAAEQSLFKFIPELTALYDNGHNHPLARYVEKDNLKSILEDVLTTCSGLEEKVYRVISASSVRDYLYEHFPEFSRERINKNIKVKVLALGQGGELRGLDERKFLQTTIDSATYILIYGHKVASIALDAAGAPFGVVIENAGIAQTQAMMFDEIWK